MDELMHLLTDVTREGHLVVQGGGPFSPLFLEAAVPNEATGKNPEYPAFRVGAALSLPSALSGRVESSIRSIMCLFLLLGPGPQIIAFLDFTVFQREEDTEMQAILQGTLTLSSGISQRGHYPGGMEGG